MKVYLIVGIFFTVSFLQLCTSQELPEERNDILEWYYNLSKQDFINSKIPRDKRQSRRFGNSADYDNEDSEEWYVFDEVEPEPIAPRQPTRGQFSWFSQQPRTFKPFRQNAITSTSPRPQIPNAGPPRPSRCVENCMARTTSEYNPVCGSNGATFNNRAKLDCASFCGINVKFQRFGRCTPILPPPP